MRQNDAESVAGRSRTEFAGFPQNVGRRSFLTGIASFLFLAGVACRKAVQAPAEITLVLIDQTWLDRSFQDRRNLELYCTVQNIRVASLRAARRKLVKLFRKPKLKFYWYNFTVRGRRYRGSTLETKSVRALKIASLRMPRAV